MSGETLNGGCLNGIKNVKKNVKMDTTMKVKKNAKLKLTGKVKLTFKNETTGDIEILEYNNLVVNTGIYAIASRLSGTDIPANTMGVITYCAVGTGTDAAAAGDTALQTEVARKQIADGSSALAVATFRTYFNTSEAIATLKEVGLFGDDATSVADSGTLYCRAAIDKEKTSANSLTVDWEVSVADVV